MVNELDPRQRGVKAETPVRIADVIYNGHRYDLSEPDQQAFQEVYGLASGYVERGSIITRDGKDILRFRNRPTDGSIFKFIVEKSLSQNSVISTTLTAKTHADDYSIEFRTMSRGQTIAFVHNKDKRTIERPPEVFAERAKMHMEWVDKEERARALGEEPSFTTLIAITDRTEQQRILDTMEVHEDVAQYYKEFTPELLERNGLAPAFSMRLSENRTAHFSKVYEGERLAVVAYIEDGDKVTPRTFYFSQSHGVWRFLPYITGDGAFGKGRGQDTLNLPIPLQQALAHISETNSHIALDKGTATMITSATSPIADRSHSHISIIRPHGNVGRPTNEDKKYGRQLLEYEAGKQSPEDLDLAEDGDLQLRPDYESTVRRWNMQSPILGNLMYETLESNDGSLEYLFITGNEGQVWIGSVDVVAGKIRPTGTRDAVMDLGFLLTPAFEYDYGWRDADWRNGYYDITPWFHNRIPMIRAYKEARGIR